MSFLYKPEFLSFILIVFCLPAFAIAAQKGQLDNSQFLDEDELNFYCLKKSYPQILAIESDNSGAKWLILQNGRRLAYKDPALTGLSADIAGSMRQLYPLEPVRPDTPPGFAPGRLRPYDLFDALYGSKPLEIQRNLVPVHIRGRSMRLSPHAAKAFEKAIRQIETLERGDSKIAKFLKPDGGYAWRKIAGEAVKSAHSYGIAFDIGSKYAPYWRWSKIQPHPLQKAYPAEIVKAFEDAGFIWGGKWHEYDLMHFEYRPELICKAQALAARKNQADLP